MGARTKLLVVSLVAITACSKAACTQPSRDTSIGETTPTRSLVELSIPRIVRAAETHAPERIPAKMFLPSEATGASAKRVPAMVIVVSSGCVAEAREPYYARVLAEHGIAGVVVDSCTPRGIRSTVDDQSRMTGWEVENDAWATLAALSEEPHIDPARIGVMGVSKGGNVALNTALVVRRRWHREASTLRFAAHVPIVPGCATRHKNAETTGAPIFFMLGAADDYTPAAACLTYVEAMRAKGRSKIDVRVYEGAHHAWESLGSEPRLLPRAENYSRCFLDEEDDGSFALPDGGSLPGQDFIPWARANCMYIGNTHAGGGNEALKERATADLVAFLRASGF